MLAEEQHESGHRESISTYHQNYANPPTTTYNENNHFAINLVNAPDDSLVQCDCGHINCPMCNLMMNLELTEPTWNQN